MFFANLISGDIRLWKVFWFGVIINLLLNTITMLSVNNKVIYITIAFISVVYLIILWISVWNSANNYKGFKLWAILAKTVVVFGLLSTITSIASTLS